VIYCLTSQLLAKLFLPTEAHIKIKAAATIFPAPSQAAVHMEIYNISFFIKETHANLASRCFLHPFIPVLFCTSRQCTVINLRIDQNTWSHICLFFSRIDQNTSQWLHIHLKTSLASFGFPVLFYTHLFFSTCLPFFVHYLASF